MIYLDNAATTPMDPHVRHEMGPYLDEMFGNPSSIHTPGRSARRAIDTARHIIASWLGCNPRHLIFTSGGTEADAAALTGTFLARRETHPHIVASAIEHHAVLHTLDFLKSLGATVSYVPVDVSGQVQIEDVLDAIRPDTCLATVMSVNNELGTVEPIAELATAIKSAYPEVLVHSDMVQALPFVASPLKNASNVDMAVFSAHKIHGPKGIGLLYVRPNIGWIPMLYGGQQEAKRRGGTENVAAIVGFGAAVQKLQENFESSVHHLYALRDTFFKRLSACVEVVRLSPESGAPTILNVAFPNVRSDTLLMRLDLAGVAASAGSACTAGTMEQSHVIQAAGLGHLDEAVRFSFGQQNTIREIEQAADVVAQVVQDLARHNQA